MRIEQDIKLDYDDVLIRPKRSDLKSRSEIILERTYEFINSGQSWTGIPIIVANMDAVATVSMAKVMTQNKMMVALSKFIDPKEFAEVDPDFNFFTIGIRDDDYDNLVKVSKLATVKNICIDAANAYTTRFVDVVKRVRHDFPTTNIMAGNVVTGEMTEELILSGADIVKIGVGPGSACITRKVAGVGYPQLSAVIECADAAHGLKGLVCADGGLKSSGDFVKAFGAGADFVMSGSMFAGHDESEMEIIEKDGKKYLPYYGSSSNKAMKLHGGKQSYRASEGRELLLEYKGPVQNTIDELLGGIRSGCTYVGARKLKELSKRTTFIRVNRQLNRVHEGKEE